MEGTDTVSPAPFYYRTLEMIHQALLQVSDSLIWKSCSVCRFRCNISLTGSFSSWATWWDQRYSLSHICTTCTLWGKCFPHVSLPQKWKNYRPEFSVYLSNHTVTTAVTSGMVTVNMEIFKGFLLVTAVPFTSSGLPELHAWNQPLVFAW